MFSWFKTKSDKTPALLPVVDVHSHLLSALDDGVQSLAEATELIKQFQKLGYKKLITTPHVMSDFYRNTPDDIFAALTKLRNHLISEKVSIDIEAAAEYYLDEELIRKVESNEKLLTFGSNYLLFETNFMTEPMALKEFIFLASTKGYKLVLAHPERYVYLQNDIEKAEDLLNRGVLFQLNLSSVSGYYSKGAQELAKKLIDKEWIHFVGSDCHNQNHMNIIQNSTTLSYFKKAMSLPLLNNSLLHPSS